MPTTALPTTLHRARFSRRIPSPLSALILALRVWAERKALRQLEPHRLADLGLCDADVRREVRRLPWDHGRGAG